MCAAYGRAKCSRNAGTLANRTHHMRNIPIDVLRAFVAVVDARGFTRAAEDLGRSQPTISLQVKRLEELVEAPLFDKAAPFELTGVGAVCFDYGRRLLPLHVDMLGETERRRTTAAALRVRHL